MWAEIFFWLLMLVCVAGAVVGGLVIYAFAQWMANGSH